MSPMRTALGLGLALSGAPCFAACSSDATPGAERASDGGSGIDSEDNTGSISFRFSLPGGEHIASVSYRVANASKTITGTAVANLTNAIHLVVGGIPAGDGYAIGLSATSDDGTVTCTGSYGTGISDAGQDNGAPFSVLTQQSTFLNVQMICVKNKS